MHNPTLPVATSSRAKAAVRGVEAQASEARRLRRFQPKPIAVWHACVAKNDLSAFLELVADDAVFQSPALHAPQVGKAKVAMYLQGALMVLNKPGFRYVEEWVSPGSAVLEFEGNVDGMAVNGIDLIRWNDDGRVTGFKVMVRPFKGLTALMEAMQRLLQP